MLPFQYSFMCKIIEILYLNTNNVNIMLIDLVVNSLPNFLKPNCVLRIGLLCIIFDYAVFQCNNHMTYFL